MKKIGREVLFISTDENNPRNGEGSFIRLKDGSILFGYTEYIGTAWNDHADARLCSVISHDEGETWGRTPYVCAVSDDRGVSFNQKRSSI